MNNAVINIKIVNTKRLINNHKKRLSNIQKTGIYTRDIIEFIKSELKEISRLTEKLNSLK